MKYYRCLVLLVFLSSWSVFSQEKYKQHTVLKGETISQIAAHYKIKAESIYELNPDAINGIKYKMVLLIPTQTKNHNKSSITVSSNSSEKEHEVLPKETVYGITKQYKVSLEELYKSNPSLEKEGLKIGQIIKIPQTASENLVLVSKTEKLIEVKKPAVSKNSIKEEIVLASKKEEKIAVPTEGITYEVLPKESLYSIAKKYGIKLSDLQKANPILETTSLKAGQKIIIPVKEEVNLSLVEDKKEIKVEKKTQEIEEPKVIPVVVKEQLETEITHEILPKESLYSIAKQYGITLSDLQKANPTLANKTLRVGQKIIIPGKGELNSSSTVVQKEAKVVPKIPVSPQPNGDDKKPEIEISHQVLPKETKYGIAKQYGLTVAELEKQNPNIVKKLLVGSTLAIRTSKEMEVKIPVQEVVVAKEESVNKEVVDTNIGVYDVTFVDQLISKASENMGTRYRSGGTTKDGFDCSGLMYFTFSAYDIKLPRSSIEMASYGSKIDTENARKGDLIFFRTGGRGRINHVGMVVEVIDGEIKFIHSATHGGVMISSTKESYYEKCLAQVNRVL